MMLAADAQMTIRASVASSWDFMVFVSYASECRVGLSGYIVERVMNVSTVGEIMEPITQN